MCKEYSLLLIGASGGDPWHHVIEAAAKALGSLRIADEGEVSRLIQQHSYDVVIVDAAKVEDIYPLISSIRTWRPETKIVVVTMSPTWKRARQAFRAGATDYIRKSMNKADVLSALEASLGKIVPASSNE